MTKEFPKIHIMGINQFSDWAHLFRDCNVISIRESRGIDENTRKRYEIIDRLNLPNIYVACFDDLSDDSEASYGKLPQKEDVQSIIEWAKQKWSENHKDFVVHCHGGVSRSSSIATLIAHALNDPNAMNTFNGKFHSPNKRIMGFGEEILNKPNLAKETEEKAKREFKENGGQIF